MDILKNKSILVNLTIIVFSFIGFVSSNDFLSTDNYKQLYFLKAVFTLILLIPTFSLYIATKDRRKLDAFLVTSFLFLFITAITTNFLIGALSEPRVLRGDCVIHVSYDNITDRYSYIAEFNPAENELRPIIFDINYFNRAYYFVDIGDSARTFLGLGNGENIPRKGVHACVDRFEVTAIHTISSGKLISFHKE